MRSATGDLDLEPGEALVRDAHLERGRLGHDRGVRPQLGGDGLGADARELLVADRGHDDVARELELRRLRAGPERRGHAALHVEAAAAVQPIALDARLERALVAVVPDRVGVPVEQQRAPAAGAARNADHVGAAGRDLSMSRLTPAASSQPAMKRAISISPAPPGTRSGLTESIATSSATSSRSVTAPPRRDRSRRVSRPCRASCLRGYPLRSEPPNNPSEGAPVSTTDLAALAAELKAKGVRALTVAWCDSNGIQRSRSAPIDKLASAVERGMGCSFLFAVFDSHDHIHWGVEGVDTPTGDFRVKAVPERIVQLAGQPAFAWAPGQLWLQEGPRWEHCYRAALERHRRARSGPGLRVQGRTRARVVHRPGLRRAGGGAPRPGLQPERDARRERVRLRAARRPRRQRARHRADPRRVRLVAAGALARCQGSAHAADDQLLARETIRTAARANGLRASFAPLITPDGVGNGWHFHVSIHKDGRNLLSGGDGPEGMTPEGESFVAGILRDLQGVVAVTAPSVPSLIRLRPGYFASAYAFWGADNREASLRFVPGAEAIGAQNANIELKASDASGNPYLGLTAMIACGLGGIEDGLEAARAHHRGSGPLDARAARGRGVRRFAQNVDEQIVSFESAPRIREAFGDPLANAFTGVRRSDADWAEGKSAEEIIAAHLWRY